MILAGGRGTRFKEYTEKIPKPMIEALGKPLLIHIIEIYKKFNVTNIIILGGYKNEIIVDYFARNYETLNQDTKKYIYDEVNKYKISVAGLHYQGTAKRYLNKFFI